MKYYNKIVKLFIKTPQIIITYILLFFISNIFMCKLFVSFWNEYQAVGSSASDSLYFYGDIRFLGIVLFICWFFISFELAKKLDTVKEVFVALGKRSIIPYMNQILVLLLGIVIIAADISVYAILAYECLECPPQIFSQMIKVLVWDVLFLSMASSGMGLLVSCIKGRFAGYVIFLLLILCMVPDYYSILRDMLPLDGGIIEKLHDIVCFLPQDVSYTYDSLYGLPFERYRLAGMLFWIVVGVAAFIRVYYIKGKILKRFVIGVYVVAAFLLLTGVINKGSVLRMDDELRNVTSYYADHVAKVEETEYEVTKYQIDFKIRNELTAKCRMELGGNIDQEKYILTLYHGYTVKNIYDSLGEKMNFDQDGDYITIYVDKPTDYLTLDYSGVGGFFYSNQNACFLPGFFPYYPRIGFLEIFDTDNQIFLSNQDKKVQFDIGLDVPGDCVVNLSKENNRYKGTTENLTIISGNYEEITDDTNKCVVLPMQKSSYQFANQFKRNGIQKQWNQLIKYLDGDLTEEFDQSLCVIIPNSTTFATHLEGIYLTDSCLLLSKQFSAYSVLRQKIGVGKYGGLKQIFFELEPGEDFDIHNFEYHRNFVEKEYYTKDDELYDLVLDKMSTVGVQKTAQQIYQYISSDHYQENVDEELLFVQSIK